MKQLEPDAGLEGLDRRRLLSINEMKGSPAAGRTVDAAGTPAETQAGWTDKLLHPQATTESVQQKPAKSNAGSPAAVAVAGSSRKREAARAAG